MRLLFRPLPEKIRILLPLVLLFSALSLQAQPTSQSSSLPSGERIEVIEIQVDENSKLDSDKIRAVLHQKIGSPLDEDAIRDDIKSIFALGNVFDVQVDLVDPKTVRYIVRQLPEIVEFEIKGDKPKYLEGHDYIPYEYFNGYAISGLFKQEVTLPRLKATSQEVQENLRKLGYMNATVSAEIKVDIGSEDVVIDKILVVYDIKLGHRFFVSGVFVSGNQELSIKEIKSLLVTRSVKSKRMKRKYGYFSQILLDNDILALKAKYLENGFVDVDVNLKEIKVDERDHGVGVYVEVNEGTRYSINSVSCDSVYGKDLSVASGENYDTAKIRKDIEAVSSYFQDQGYANVTVIPDVVIDSRNKSVSVFYRIVKGDLFYFGNIKKDFIELKKLPSDSFIDFKTGDLYSKSKIDRTKKNLENTQNFNQVKITTETTETPNVLDVTIQSGFRDIGGGRLLAYADPERPYWLYHRVTINNWLGYRNIIESQYRLFDNEQTFGLGVSRFFSRGTGLSLSGFDATYKWPLQSYQKLGGALQVSQRFTKSLSGALVYALYRNRSEVSSALLPGSLDGDGRRVTLLAGLTFDSRDFGQRGHLEHAGGFVGKGWYLSAQAELDADWLGSTQESFALHLRAARFFTLRDGGRQVDVPGGITLKILGRLDRAWSLAGQELPYTERFFLGGIGTVRGFGLQSLGTQVEEGGRLVNIGGDHAYSGTIEVEFPFVDELFEDGWRRLRWALFVDAGNAFNREVPGFSVIPTPQDFGKLPVRTSAGLSLRWYVPYLMGPMRFDLARPLDAQPGEGLQAHFSISTEL